MKKSIIFTSILFFCGKAFSQAPANGIYLPKQVTSYGLHVARILPDSASFIPTGCGAPVSLQSSYTGLAAHYFDSCNAKYYIYNPSTADWDSIHVGAITGGGGTGVSSVSDLSPLFTTTNPTTTPTFNLSNTSQYNIWGRKASGSGVPSYLPADSSLIVDLHSENYYNTKYLGINSTIPISSLTAATATNSIDNTNLAQSWTWSKLGTGGNGYGLYLHSGSTTDTINPILFQSLLLGSYANSSMRGTSGYFFNNKTGTSSTNVGIQASAYNGTTNIAALFDRGSVNLGTVGTESGVINWNGSISGTVKMQPAAAAGTWTMTLPTSAGTNGYVLSTDGSGVTSWVANGGGVSSVSGTTNRITSTGGTTPVIDIDAAYDAAVSAKISDSLTANELVITNLGTNTDSIAVFANGPDSLKFKKPASGTNTTAWSNTTDFGFNLSGTIPISLGGTNNSSLSATNGGILYMDGSKVVALPIGGVGQGIRSVGGVPVWRDTAVAGGGASTTTTDNRFDITSNVLTAKKTPTTLTDGATITWDAQTSYNARVVLGDNRTLAITNPQAGDYYTITVVQDGTGSRTLTLPGGGSAVLNSSANDSTTLSGYYRNTGYEWRSGAVLTTNPGYAINVQALTSSPADAATVYFGTLPKAPTTTAATSKVYVRNAGIITGAEIYCYSGTAGTAESWSLYIRVNNTTDYLISTLTAGASERIFTNSALNISLAAGDYFEIKGIQPTWATNPLTTIYGGYIKIK